MRYFPWFDVLGWLERKNPSEVCDSADLKPGAPLIVEAPEHPEAERIARSLYDFPSDWVWKHRTYTIVHRPTGFMLWVANEEYGLEVRTHNDGKQPFKKEERAIIWPAVESWLAGNRVTFTGRLPKPRLTQVTANGAWRCKSADHLWIGIGSSPSQAFEAWQRAVSVERRGQLNPDYPLCVWSGH